ncbi:MAG: S-adenosylmethionine:tRNA ribosyltransferase-isomerase, partial [Candidatus Kapaibacterium sp.]
MITTNQIKTKDFDYNLPVEKIALKPLRIRSKSKLLVYKCLENEIIHNRFEEIDKFIEEGSLIIANDTKVIKARIPFRKSNELNAEIFLLEPKYPSTDTVITLSSKGNCSWICMTGNLSKKQLKEVYKIHVLEQELKFTFTKLSNDIIVN